MGFFDKIKNMFTEEVEDDDVKVEKIKNEVTHVAIESPNAKVGNYNDEIISSLELKNEEKSIKPVFFDDNDFRDLNLLREEKKEEKRELKVKDSYKQASNTKSEEKRVFKPTPIISPVYGILDKNYHKEDIVSKNEVRTNVNNDELSIDSIRNKAYGTLEDELENTLFGNNSILFNNDEVSEKDVELSEISDDALSSLTDDISKELDELLIKKEKYSDEEIRNTIKNDENLNEEDLLGFIDSTLYKDGDDE